MQQKHEIKFNKATGPRFIIRVLFNGLGLWIAARLSASISYDDSLVVILIAAILFSVANAVLRPVLIILTLPVVILSLGLFMLVINGFMVWLVSALYEPFEVATFGSAVMAAIIVWIVNYGLSMFFERSTLEIKKERLD